MIEIKDKAQCCGCSGCASACPKGAIVMKADSEGFPYPSVNMDLCINCGICKNVCPILNPLSKSRSASPKAYAAYSRDEETRKESSSGGVFSLLAEHIISQNGVVFGAAFDESFQVYHLGIEDISQIPLLRCSKYVQSRIGDTYKQAKQFLEEGRLVLFTGTPCQISGLYNYLSKDYDNLYTQDIVCHGVPSPKLWEKYLAYWSNRFSSSVKSVSFRNKIKGWKNFSIVIGFENNKKYIKHHREDLLFKAFLDNKNLRPSCYECAFKGIERPSDITLGDFWGYWNLYPDKNDDKGISLITANSQKGLSLWQAVESKAVSHSVDIMKASDNNSAMTKSVPRPEKRDSFMKDMEQMPIDTVLKKYSSESLAKKIKRRIKRIFHL